MKKITKIILPATATALLLSQMSCEKEDMTDKLIGQWEFDEMDGDLEEMLDADYEMNLEFHMDGDAEFCMIEDEYKYCIIGDWEWDDETMTELTIDFGEVEFKLRVDAIEGDVLTGELTIDAYDTPYGGDVVMERVYVDKSALMDKELKNLEEVEN